MSDRNGDIYLTAECGGVDVPGGRLVLNPRDGHLTMGGGDRQQNRRLDTLAEHIVTYVTMHPGESTSAIERALRAGGVVHFQKGDVGLAAKIAVSRGRLAIRPGPRGAYLFSTP